MVLTIVHLLHNDPAAAAAANIAVDDAAVRTGLVVAVASTSSTDRCIVGAEESDIPPVITFLSSPLKAITSN